MERLDAQVLVIGSGPGGATTAVTLAEAGHDVLIAEEGPHLSVDACEAFSFDEMQRKWRSGGLTPAFGKPEVTYIEGRCVGGASEINAALYHPPVPEVLDGWGPRYGIDAIDHASVRPFLDEVKQTYDVSRMPGGPGLQSTRLLEGAQALGWKTEEVERFWKYDGTVEGQRRSMSVVTVPRAVAAGARLRAGLQVVRLRLKGGVAVAADARTEDGRRVRIHFDAVFVCAGAVQTALVLRRSGFGRGLGDSLTINPMVRVVVKFPEKVNQPELGVPTQQVSQFKPLMTLGCSHGSLPHLALWLVGSPGDRERALAEWDRYGVYYALVTGASRGKVRNVPVFNEAFVRFPLTGDDLAALGDGLHHLGSMLFTAGAEEMINPVPGEPAVRSISELDGLRSRMLGGDVQVSAIHLHSSVPMGAEALGGKTNSWGRVYGTDNVYVNDSSLLPDSPGINPQGLIIAIALRNARHFVENRRQ